MLSKLNHMRESREQGFTLIELLVVILIIGILAAIAIPMFLNQRKAAVDSSVQSDVSNAAKQIETWVVKQGATEETIESADLTDMNIKLSDGTGMRIQGTSFDYTITGVNSGGDRANAENGGIVYESQAGGLADGTGTVTLADGVLEVAAP